MLPTSSLIGILLFNQHIALLKQLFDCCAGCKQLVVQSWCIKPMLFYPLV